MRVVVIGGGFGGLAAAARLAKLGHEVTLLESSTRVGGALRPVQRDGYTWEASASHTLLPAVVRDLFRKSGRPLERELELVNLPVLRQHHFADNSVLRVPGNSRAAQLRAFDELAPGLGSQWCDYVSSWTHEWEVLRRHYLEHPWSGEHASPDARGLLASRESLHRRIRRRFRDKRLRLVASYPFELAGQSTRDLPAWMGVTAYLEQTFGGWRPGGGMGELVTALERRLATRRVVVHTGTTARDLVVRGGRAVAVATADGEVDADGVVVAVDPRRLPLLREHVERTMPAIPPVMTHLGLVGDLPDLPPETVFHGEPTITVRTSAVPPSDRRDGRAWTLLGRGRLAGDLVGTLARYGLDLRGQIEVAHTLTPRDLVEEWNGSPEGVRWQGRDTVRRRLGPRTPVPGVYAAGAHATPGSGLPFVGLSAAQVAELIGPAQK